MWKTVCHLYDSKESADLELLTNSFEVEREKKNCNTQEKECIIESLNALICVAFNSCIEQEKKKKYKRGFLCFRQSDTTAVFLYRAFSKQ